MHELVRKNTNAREMTHYNIFFVCVVYCLRCFPKLELIDTSLSVFCLRMRMCCYELIDAYKAKQNETDSKLDIAYVL